MATWYVATTGSDSNSGTSSGSPFLTIGKGVSSAASGDTIAVKAGTYVITSTIDISLPDLIIEGYETSPGDMGTKPLITTATNSTVLFATSSSAGVQQFINLELTNTAATTASGIWQPSPHGTGQYWVFVKCLFSGFGAAIDCSNTTPDDVGFVHIFGCEFTSCVYGYDASGSSIGSAVIYGCDFHDNSDYAIYVGSGVPSLRVARTQIVNNGADGIYFTGNNGSFYENTIANNAGAGIDLGGSNVLLSIVNNVLYGNGGGINCGALAAAIVNSASAASFNAFGNNTSGNTNWPGNPADPAITADPFTDPSTRDYSLNGAAGGGALLKAAGLPSTYGGTTATSLDMGTAQGVGGGSTTVVPVAQDLLGGTTGTSYTETIGAQGGTSPYTFAVTSGALPTSCSLDASTGVISGTPSAAGTFNFSITATDSLSNTGSQAFTIVIASPTSGGSAVTFLS